MDERLKSLIEAYRTFIGQAPHFAEQTATQEDPPVSDIVTMFDNHDFKDIFLRDGDPNDMAFAAKPLTTHYYETGEEAYVDLAIKFLQSALLKISDNAAVAEALHDLGVACYLRFNQSGDTSDLDLAIENQRKAVEMTSDDNPQKTTYLSNLGNSCSVRFEQTGDIADLEEAIAVQQQSLSLISQESSDRPGLLSNLAASFNVKFEITGDQDDLRQAISSQREALASAPDKHPFRPLMLGNIGTMLDTLFEQTGDFSDLEKSIQFNREAVLLTPDSHPDRPRRLSNLAASLENRFSVTKGDDDITESIKLLRQAIDLTTDGQPSRPSIFHKLGQSLQTQAIHLGSPDQLKEAIQCKEKAISFLSDDHPDKKVYLSSLGVTYRKQFDFNGALADIDKAIQSQQQAILLSAQDATDRVIYLNSVGVSFVARFEHTGALHDLEEAIRTFRNALLSTSDDHPGKPQILNNLGTALESRFEKTFELQDLIEAIEYQKQALSLIPDISPNKAGMLLNLGDTFLTQYKQTKEFAVLEEGIRRMEEAAGLSINDTELRPVVLSNLGNALEDKYGHTGSQDDLENSVRSLRQASHLLPEWHAAKSGLLTNLARAIHSLFKATGQKSYLDESVLNYQSAATANVGPPLVRFKAAREWSRLAATHNLSSAKDAFLTAMSLIPRIAWVGDDISKRRAQLLEIGDFPREAAAFALSMSNADLALEWLEQGRSIIWNQLLSLQTPIDDLRTSHPDIASELSEVSHRLHNAGIRQQEKRLLSDDENFTLEEEARQHHRLAEKWEDLLRRIRLLPQFEDFLLPKRVGVLSKAAEKGPVVVISVYQSRCDALVLEPGKVQATHIPLQALSYDDVQRMQGALKKNLSGNNVRSREARAGGSYPGRAKSTMSPLGMLLSEMYKKIVLPILEALGLKKGISDKVNLPRLWWCPTGPLTFLPLHAASLDIQKGGDETAKYVVSSYTPTVNALLQARSAKRQTSNRFLGVAMTHTPVLPPLPNAATELLEIRQSFEGKDDWSYHEYQNQDATAEVILSEMAESSWVHLACHAVQDIADPTESGLCLQDRRLDILSIIAKPFPHADLAFLSACETATGDEKTSDEALHITGSMLGAGYRGVIGTMWSIPDEAAPIVASGVYKRLLDGSEANSERAAYALHEAIQVLRKSSTLEMFYAWAPFVHFGI